MAGYNLTRFVEELLETHDSSPPSFTVHLYPEYWTLNNGSKFLYNNQVASLLDDIRAQRIPNDFLELFDAARVPFYDGCMIVELLDYRPPKGKDPVLEKPERTRVVLSPNSETLWSDICLLNQKIGSTWTDEDALEIEARILMTTSPPLCLDPDPHLTRIANSILRVSVPTTPASLKRKAAAMEMEEDEMERTRRTKIMQYMNPKSSRSTVPNYRILDVLHRMKTQQAHPPVTQPPQSTQPTTTNTMPLSAAAVPPPPITVAPVPSPYVAPTAARATPPPVATPTPPLPTGSASQDSKKKVMKSESRQSPVLNRPSSTVPPTAIPPHMQPHYAVGRATPNPYQPSQTPRPPSTVAAARSPISPEKRPPSTSQQISQLPQSQSSPAQRAAIAAAPHAQQQPSHFQAAVPPLNFLTAPPKKKLNAPQQASHPQAQHMTPQQAQIMYTAQQMQVIQQHHMASQARMAQPAQSASTAPQGSGQGTPQRNSPMITTQQLTSRSPMPPGAQQPPQMTNPQQQSYNFVALQSQYNAAAAHMRPMVPGHPQHPQMMHLATANQTAAQQGQAAGQGAQDQTQTHPTPMIPAQYAPMLSTLNYAQMGMNMQQGRVPAFWHMGIGRGMPVANAQHQMAGMAGHPQQMPHGAAKPAPAGMQGSNS